MLARLQSGDRGLRHAKQFPKCCLRERVVQPIADDAICHGTCRRQPLPLHTELGIMQVLFKNILECDKIFSAHRETALRTPDV